MSDASPSTDHSPTSTEEETLPLLYDLDKQTQIPEGEFTKDIPPPPIGECNKKKKQSPTQNGQPGTSSALACSGNQVEVKEEEDGEEDEEESDDENDERPSRSTNQLTLEERLRRELEYIDNLLEQDADEDQENLLVSREQWRAADFVEEDLAYASIDVLVMDALRHLQTVGRNSTLRLYTSWIYHYKRNCADRRRGTIGDTYTAEQFRQIKIRVLPTWAAKAWNPRGTGPSQTLWRFLLLKVLTLLSHHSLLCGQGIREIPLPDIFLYRLASTLSVNPENEPVVMISQFHGVRLIPPVDTSTRASWYKKHLFFAKNDTDQGELSAASHQRWTRQLWDKNGVFCKRNVHAARARGAQELAIDGTPRAEIAELGHWALDKMTRAVEPSEKLLKLLTEHIFPGVDDMLKTAEGKAAKGSDVDKSTVHFWGTLQMLRRIVAEDLAVKLVRTPWHLYEISVRFDIEYYNMSLKAKLTKEMERAANEKIEFLEELKKRDDTIASLTAEITLLTEALRV
ncbi:unnamed protein product [Closterium sp. NIES-64]|nr:unnamed protein product [Closterium sp. NIES-64]